MKEPSVQNMLTFIGFNITIATLFFALVYSYAKNLLERLYAYCQKTNLKIEKDNNAKDILKFFYTIDLITISALGLLAYSSLFGALFILRILNLLSSSCMKYINFFFIILYFVYDLIYLRKFKEIRVDWYKGIAKRIFSLVLILQIIFKIILIVLNVLNCSCNFEYLLFVCIVILVIHLVLCLLMSIKYTPITKILELWGLTVQKLL